MVSLMHTHGSDDTDLKRFFQVYDAAAAMRWEQVPCNLCGSERSSRVFTIRDYRFLTDQTDFNVVRCAKCSLVRVDPRPVEADIHRYYHDDFYRGQEGPEEAL